MISADSQPNWGQSGSMHSRTWPFWGQKLLVQRLHSEFEAQQGGGLKLRLNASKVCSMDGDSCPKNFRSQPCTPGGAFLVARRATRLSRYNPRLSHHCCRISLSFRTLPFRDLSTALHNHRHTSDGRMHRCLETWLQKSTVRHATPPRTKTNLPGL